MSIPKIAAVMKSRFAGLTQLVISAGIFIISIGSTAASTTPLLCCAIDQGGIKQVLEFSPESSPYMAKAIDINDQFRFKAVVVGKRT